MRQCSWCHRELEDLAFALKPGMRVRYRICRECQTLGHSCVKHEKPKRRVMTAEERKEHYRQYLRRYQKEHAEAIRRSNRESYLRRKNGMPKRKTGPKPKQEAARDKQEQPFPPDKILRTHDYLFFRMEETVSNRRTVKE